MTTYTATPAQSNRPANSSGWAKVHQVAVGSLDLSTALAATDVLKMCKLPRGAIVFGGKLIGDKLTSGTIGSQSMTLNIGVDASVTTFTGTNVATTSTSTALGSSLIPNGDAVSGVKPEAGYNLPLGGLIVSDGPFQLQDDATVYVTVVASAGGGSFVSGTLTLEVDYYMGVHA